MKNEGGDGGNWEAGVEMSFAVNEGNAISFSKCLDVPVRGEVGAGEMGEARVCSPGT